MTRSVRLLKLVALLRAGGSYTTAELAARFGCSQRTIQEDLLILQGEPFYLPLEDTHRREWRLVEVGRAE